MEKAQNMNTNVKMILKQKRWSIRQLAEKLDLPASSLNDSLKSKKGLPIDIALRIAEMFGCTVEELASNDFVTQEDIPLSAIQVLAAHRPNSGDYTEDELDEIEDFKKFVMLKRKN